MTDAKKPTMAGADPGVLTAQARQAAQAHQQIMAQRKNMMLGVAVNAPVSLDDAFAVANWDDEGFAKALTDLAQRDDMDMDHDIVSALAEPTLRKHIMAIHARLSVEWAVALTVAVNDKIEGDAAAEGKAAAAKGADT